VLRLWVDAATCYGRCFVGALYDNMKGKLHYHGLFQAMNYEEQLER